MATKKKIYLEFRYDRSHGWTTYDWTQVARRVDALYAEMQREHPDALEYRKVSK